jgi:hypothetical protein
VIRTGVEPSSEHDPLFTTALKYVLAVSEPIVAPVRVVVVPDIVVGELKARSDDFSHLTTEPVCPLRLISEGVDPVQIDCADDTAPPTVAGSTVIRTGVEPSSEHDPLLTTALKYVLAVSEPIVAPARVVVVPDIVVGELKARSDDFSHLTTEPVCPLRLISDGVEPEQMV